MNIIITGASSGVGYETARQLAVSFGQHVIAIARSKDKLEKLSTQVKKENPDSKLEIIAGDLADENSLVKIIEEIKKHFGHVDVLVNNAGALINKPFEELTADDWKSVYATNVFAPVNLIRRLLPLLASPPAPLQRRGEEKRHIVNISSMGGVQGSAKFKGLSAYSSGKAALINITECLAEEFKEKNIAVNCLALGSVQTEMFANAFPDFKASATAESMGLFVAGFVLNGANYFNGKVIPVSNSTP